MPLITSIVGDKVITNYYRNQLLSGGGFKVYKRSTVFHRGHSGSGFSSIIGKLFQLAKPILKSSGKYLAKKGLKAVANTASDVIAGDNIKEAAKKNAIIAFDNFKTDLRKKVIKRVAPSRNFTRKRKKIKYIFILN